MLDGELDSSEREELLSHLADCPCCRSQIRSFEQVNFAVESLSQRKDLDDSQLATLPRPTLPRPMLPRPMLPRPNGVASLSKPKPLAVKRRIAAAWRLIPLAAAATLMICLGITALPDPGAASAEQIPPEQFVEPMKEFLENNFQRQNDQELMLRTLGWDLRAMKLELNQLDPDSAERINLESQIDAMLAKVQLFETDSIPDSVAD
jgi:hypothetical protein